MYLYIVQPKNIFDQLINIWGFDTEKCMEHLCVFCISIFLVFIFYIHSLSYVSITFNNHNFLSFTYI